MKAGPNIASLAAVIGDPARANMLTALMDGRALTVSELAHSAGVTLPTASGHLAKLEAAGLTQTRKQGRHRYVALSAPDVAEVIEGLMSLAHRTGATRVRTGPQDPALREARVCYDHLAGARAVALMDAFIAANLIDGDVDTPALTAAGRARLGDIGIDLSTIEHGRRPLCRACLDWSERKSHLGGALGGAILDHALGRGWVVRCDGRIVRFTPRGASAFDAAFLTSQ